MSWKCFDAGMPAQVLARTSFALALLLLPVHSLFADSCKVVHHAAPSEADTAFLAADYAKAVALYQAALVKSPGQADLTVGLVHALLRQQKVQEASDALQASTNPSTKSAALMTLRGEVELRQGDPWKAAQTAVASHGLDDCNPRTLLLLSRLAKLNSQYATAMTTLVSAHLIDPDDPEIRLAWIRTLPATQRIPEMEAYLAAPRGDTAEEVSNLHTDLDQLKAWAAEPRKPCSLVSRPATAEIPFAAVKNSANRPVFFGLDVKVNNRSEKLAIDTVANSRLPIDGVSGILLKRSVAEHLGLKTIIENEVPGVGHQGPRAGYIAYADSISIGSLEFHDCVVQVMEGTHFIDGADGLIAMDILSDYLVTLDFPAEKLILGPLPSRPDAATSPNSPHNRYVAPEMKDYTPIFRTGSDLIMPVSVSGKRPMLFLLSTGAGSSALSPGAAFEVVKGHRDSKYEVRDSKGMVNADYLAGDVMLNFAGLSWSEPHIRSFDTSSFSDDTGAEVSGFIGLRTMCHMTLHIDYRDGLAKFDYDPKHESQFSF